MTSPSSDDPTDVDNDGTGETGALAAASRAEDDANDPLEPLDRVADDD